MFSFNFVPANKKVHKHTTHNINKIIKKNVVGVIHISLTTFYFIIDIDGNEYRLSKSSYDVKDKKIVFYKKLNNGKISKWIKLSKITENLDNFLPFGVGSIVTGNIIKEFDKEVFEIKKLLPNDTCKEERNRAIKFFIDNYDSIINNMDKEDVTINNQ